MDELARTGQLEAIVVGIDRAGELGKLKEDMQRERDLIPFQLKTPLLEYQSESRQYASFVVNMVKPIIDKHYRTLADRDNTAIMGAGLGGMVSYYMANEYPGVFGKLGMLSPLLDVGTLDAVPYYLEKIPPRDLRMYYMIGVNDSFDTVGLTPLLVDVLGRNGHPPDAIYLHANADVTVREALWRSQFKSAVLWLFNKQAPAAPAAR